MIVALAAGLLIGGGLLWGTRRAPVPPAPGTTGDDPRVLADAYAALEAVGHALEQHRAAEGVYPDALEALVPRFLEQLPRDPFRPGAPPAYSAPPGNPHGRILYSVGPDGRDQGGAPLDPVTRAGDLPYPVR